MARWRRSASSSILDPGGTVKLPPIDAVIFHHEAELGFVIGQRGKDIPEAEALDYVFGYIPSARWDRES
jgi:2-keto-4-pentenoate hydratase/2-oxohepta-3-ene-1,7-dioic acid hydratase in catechol pathway